MSDYRNHISTETIIQASQRLKNFLPPTPVMTSSILNSVSGRNLYFKCEHLQKTGSFKARGALNALLLQVGSACGVVTHSSGNHGQAVAWAAKQTNLPCCVVVPEGTSAVKTQAVTEYGAELIQCEPNLLARRRTCKQLAKDRGFSIIEPFDDYDVMAGQGTIALEMLEQVPHLDSVVVPISGGGMAAGMAIALSRSHTVKVICVEPEGKRLASSLIERRRLWSNPNSFLPTVADAIRLQSVGDLTFPILCDLVQDRIVTVSDSDIIDGMKHSFQFLKQVVEPASGAAVFAAVKAQLPTSSKHVGVVLCGGNVNIDALPWY